MTTKMPSTFKKTKKGARGGINNVLGFEFGGNPGEHTI